MQVFPKRRPKYSKLGVGRTRDGGGRTGDGVGQEWGGPGMGVGQEWGGRDGGGV